jgi:hypothetical protein
MKVTVEKGRKAIVILNFGSNPYVDMHTGLVYPDKFQVRSKTLGLHWLAETRVIAASPFVQYRFTCEKLPEKGTGDWADSPTGAFKDAAWTKLRLKSYIHPQQNGAILIGVSYPNVQELLREKFDGWLRAPTFRTARSVSEESEPDELQAIGLLDDLEPEPLFEDELGSGHTPTEELYWHEADVVMW